MTEAAVSAAPVSHSRRTAQKVGLVLAAVLMIANVPPSVSIGMEGAGWDPVVIAVAAFSIVAAVLTLVLVPFAWRGGRRSAVGIIVVLALSILPALPAFLLPADEVPVWGVMVASVGIVLTVAAIALVASGLRAKS